MERSGFRFEHFVWKWSKIAIFLMMLPYKTRWKPRFPIDYRPLVEGGIANFGIFRDVFDFLMIFPLKKKGFLGILGLPGNHASQWIRDFYSKGILLILAYF